jgi:hypothetical protein
MAANDNYEDKAEYIRLLVKELSVTNPEILSCQSLVRGICPIMLETLALSKERQLK